MKDLNLNITDVDGVIYIIPVDSVKKIILSSTNNYIYFEFTEEAARAGGVENIVVDVGTNTAVNNTVQMFRRLGGRCKIYKS